MRGDVHALESNFLGSNPSSAPSLGRLLNLSVPQLSYM